MKNRAIELQQTLGSKVFNLLNTTLFLLIILNYSSTFSQSFEWVGQLGSTGLDIGRDIVADVEGNAYVTGILGTEYVITDDTVFSVGVNRIIFAKFDSEGHLLWRNVLGETSGGTGQSIAIDEVGNVYVAGKFRGLVDFDPGVGQAILANDSNFLGIFLAKYDSNGNYIWAKAISIPGQSTAYELAVDQEQHIYLTGSFEGSLDFTPGEGSNILDNNAPFSNLFITKYSTQGEFLWGNMLEASISSSGNGIGLNGSDGFFLTGTFSGTVDMDFGNGENIFTSKGDPQIQTPLNRSDVFLASYDADGQLQWAIQIGGDKSESVNSIALGPDRSIHICGGFNSDRVYVWPQDNGETLRIAGNANGFILKYQADGTFVWAERMVSPQAAFIDDLVVDEEGNIYVNGVFGPHLIFDPFVTHRTIISVDGVDMFFAKYDAQGVFHWGRGVGGEGTDIGQGIALAPSGHIYMTGHIFTSADFDTGPANAPFESRGMEDIYVAKYSVEPPSCLVTTHLDGAPGSLRWIISEQRSCDTIYFDEHVAMGVGFNQGGIVIDRDVAIIGRSLRPGLTVVGSRGKNEQIFTIRPGKNVHFENLRIQDGRIVYDAEEAFDNRGIAIINEGNLSLKNCILYENRSFLSENGQGKDALGGAIYNNGNLFIVQTEFAQNFADGNSAFGGAIYNDQNGYVRIEQSSINGNGASGVLGEGFGGGIYNQGILEIINSTIIRNGLGGAIASGNLGGGIFNGPDGVLNMNHVTIFRNSVNTQNPASGGGIYNEGVLEMGNSVIADNNSKHGGRQGEFTISDGVNAASAKLVSLGYNLVGSNRHFNLPATHGDQLGFTTTSQMIDPRLQIWQDPFHFPHAYEPGPDSPVINAANPNDTLSLDQRGFPRPQGGRADIGAAESDIENQITAFTLIDPISDEEKGPLSEGLEIDMFDYSTGSLNIRAETNIPAVGSVVFSLNTSENFHTENYVPYAIAGDAVGNYNDWWQPRSGNYTLIATPYTLAEGQGIAGIPLQVRFKLEDRKPRMLGFTLIDPVTNVEMGSLVGGTIVDMNEFSSSSLNIRANTLPDQPGSVVFGLNNIYPVRTENLFPYAFAGDNSRDYSTSWTPASGNYAIKAAAFTEKNGAGETYGSLSVHFQIINAEARKGRVLTDEIHIYPNPTSDVLHMTLNNLKSPVITIFNELNQVVYTQKLFNLDKYELSLGHLPAGMYSIHLNNGDHISIKKLVISK